MKVYIVTYDLSAPVRDYNNLIKAIEAYEDWAKIAESVWVIKTSQSSATVRNNLQAKMDSNDLLFVGKLDNDGAWYGLHDKVSQWLLDNLKNQF